MTAAPPSSARPVPHPPHDCPFSKLPADSRSASAHPGPDEAGAPPDGDHAHRPKRTPPVLTRLAVHEASHAAARLYLGLGTITALSIDARQGGHVMAHIDEIRDHTEEHLTAHLAVMLAGRAGEEEFIKTIGASGDGVTEGSDLEQATRLAYAMETSMGFGQNMPLLFRRCSDWPEHLARNPTLAEAVNRRLEAAYGAALKIVRKQEPAISYLCGQLLQRGTLEGSELGRVMAHARKLIVG